MKSESRVVVQFESKQKPTSVIIIAVLTGIRINGGRQMWVTDSENSEREYLKCRQCGNRFFLVVKEPVKRKLHVRNASRKRFAYECHVCHTIKRIGRAGVS